MNSDFIRHAGDTLMIRMSVVHKLDGAAVDISNALAIEWIASQNGAAILNKSLGNGIEIEDGPAGVFLIVVPKLETVPLYGRFDHAARLTDSAGNAATIHYSKFSLDNNLFGD